MYVEFRTRPFKGTNMAGFESHGIVRVAVLQWRGTALESCGGVELLSGRVRLRDRTSVAALSRGGGLRPPSYLTRLYRQFCTLKSLTKRIVYGYHP